MTGRIIRRPSLWSTDDATPDYRAAMDECPQSSCDLLIRVVDCLGPVWLLECPLGHQFHREHITAVGTDTPA